MNEDIFEVGQQISIETPSRRHYLTHVVGWEKELFLITGMIYAGGIGLLSLREGSFHCYAKQITGGGYEQPVGAAIMEICRLIDERKSLDSSVPAGQDELVLQRDPGRQDPDQKAVASVFQGETSCLDEIMLVSGLPRTRTAIAVARMVRDGVIRIRHESDTLLQEKRREPVS